MAKNKMIQLDREEENKKTKDKESLSPSEIKGLKEIRSYFGVNNKTIFEHRAYSILDTIIKKMEKKQNASR